MTTFEEWAQENWMCISDPTDDTAGSKPVSEENELFEAWIADKHPTAIFKAYAWGGWRARAYLAAPPAPSVADGASIEDARDAARYRWLKEKRNEFDLMGLHSYYATKLWNTLGEQDDWNEAIDAAIAKESGK